MLWYKFWLEARWGFLLALVSLALVCELGLALPATGVLSSSDLWTRSNLLVYAWAAVATGTALGCLWTDIIKKSVLYTLALPVTRRRLFWVSVGLVAVELAVIGLLAALTIPALAPLAGQSYPVAKALLHGVLMVTGGMVFFAFSVLVLMAFPEPLTGAIVAMAPVPVLAVVEARAQWFGPCDIFWVMKGGSYFTGGPLPWGGLAISLTLCVLFLWCALQILERRDL
jgi:hypothetical protein